MFDGLGDPPRLPRDIRLLSLDVFDTALVRTCCQPDHVFCCIEQRLAGQGLPAHGFARLRRQAEALARETAWQAHGLPDVTLDGIYSHLASLTGLPATLLEAARNLEIVIELDSVRADPVVLDLFRQAGKAGIPVVFVSDMYLPRFAIETMLERHGYQGGLELFLSGERMRVKGDGSLFAAVLETFELAPNRVLHIGDNPHADGLAPAACGIRQALYNHNRQAMAKTRPLGPAVLPLSRLKAAHRPSGLTPADTEAMFRFLGRTYGTLIHGAFTKWIAEQAKANAMDLVLFFSRDGHLIKRIYDLYNRQGAGLPPSAYCCVSRYTLRLSRILDIDESACDFLLSGLQPRTVRQILGRCGLRLLPAREAALAREHGLEFDEVVNLDASSRERMRQLLGRLAIPLREQASSQRLALQGYLGRFGLNQCQRLAVVDLGWAGSLQNAFEEVVYDQGFSGQIQGYYLGLVKDAARVRAAGRQLFGFLENFVHEWDESDGGDPPCVSPLGPVALMELLHAAPHGGILGYESRHGAFRPCFADNPPERRQYDEKLSAYQDAVLRELAGRTMADGNLCREACRDAVADLSLHPSAEEGQTLGDLLHCDGIEHAGDGMPLAPAVARDATPEAVRRAYGQAYWKAGFLARNRQAAARAGLPAEAGLAACAASLGGAAKAVPPRLVLPQAAGPNPAPKTMLVLTHNLTRTGAPIVLLSWLRWLKLHTDFSLRIMRLWNEGELLPFFEELGPVRSFYDDIAVPGLDRAQQERRLADFCGENACLVFGNTAFSAEMYDIIASLGAPIVTNVHELEHVLRNYVGAQRLSAMVRHTTRFVAGSPTVRDNLINRHGIPPGRIDVVHEAIESTVRERDFLDKAARRRRLGIPEDVAVVLGCGTIERRKGADLFIEVARRVRDGCASRVLFYWFGAPSVEAMDTAALLAAHGLTDTVFFTGPKQTPLDYFLAGDVFVLPSREDCVSLVGLEACECGLPVVCFQDAGDLPDFLLPDAGRVVAHEDTAAMADAVLALLGDTDERTALGQAARAKLLRTHVTDLAAPLLLASCLVTIRRAVAGEVGRDGYSQEASSGAALPGRNSITS